MVYTMMTKKEYIMSLTKTSVTNPKKIAVFTFGRFNPITKGHEKLFKCVHALANEMGGDAFIFPSWTHGKRGLKNNPLRFETKVKFIKRLIPWANVVRVETVNSAWNATDYLVEKGYTDLYLVAGSDRVEEYDRRWTKYTSDGITAHVISAGTRDPDGDGVQGMSATKALQAATVGDVGKFKTATGWNVHDAEKLMHAVINEM